MITLEQIPMHRLHGYITTNGIRGLALDLLPNGKAIPVEVRKHRETCGDEVMEYEDRTPYLDFAGDPASIVRALAERCGLPILAGKAATREEIAMWHSHCQGTRLNHIGGKLLDAVDKKEKNSKEIAEAHKLLSGKKAKAERGEA